MVMKKKLNKITKTKALKSVRTLLVYIQIQKTATINNNSKISFFLKICNNT